MQGLESRVHAHLRAQGHHVTALDSSGHDWQGQLLSTSCPSNFLVTGNQFEGRKLTKVYTLRPVFDNNTS